MGGVKAHEIYQEMDAAVVEQMLDWFRANDRNVYKSAVASLAANRKLRPVFVQKKTLPEQYAWIQKTLQMKSCDMIGEHLLQVWLMAGNQDLLVGFCDALQIPHDGKGAVEGELPETFDDEALKAAVEGLLATHDARIVTLYLHVFNLQRAGGWPQIAAVIESNPLLALAAA
jgi:hypothetical protein